jgi:predicted transcriptional regulator
LVYAESRSNQGKHIMKTASQTPAKPSEYREWFDREVALGLEDIKAGRIVSHETVIAEAEKLIVIHGKHSKKAA